MLLTGAGLACIYVGIHGAGVLKLNPKAAVPIAGGTVPAGSANVQ